MKLKVVSFVLALFLAAVGLLLAQTRIIAPQKGRVERINVHGKSLEGNL